MVGTSCEQQNVTALVLPWAIAGTDKNLGTSETLEPALHCRSHHMPCSTLLTAASNHLP
jgi:hypothetical protein